MSCTGIVGCGLIGGSLLRALHAGAEPIVAVEIDPATRAQIASDLPGVAVHADLDALGACDLIVLAQPLPALIASFTSLSRLPHAPGCVVTDVAGIKGPVLRAAAQLPPSMFFVGGHPMAGKERGGFAAADPALFRGRAVAICAPEDASAMAVDRVARLWTAVGARPIPCSAEAHDDAVARISHLPYLAACAVATVAGNGDDLAAALAAGGFRDTTRVAEDPTVRFPAAANPNVPVLAREAARLLLEWADALEQSRSPDEALDRAARARAGLVARAVKGAVP